MALKLSRGGGGKVGVLHLGEWDLVTLRCETNNTSDPDGAEPNVGTWARSNAGILTYTFPAGSRPQRVTSLGCSFEETDVDIRAWVSGYVASTGVLTVRMSKDDGTSGVPALADSTDKTLVVPLLVSWSPMSA